MRAAVNLTARRSELGLTTYNYLIVKEVGRACVTGILCVGSVALAPSLLRKTGWLCSACLVALFSFGVANLVYNVGLQLLQALMTATGIGVPVLMFDDMRGAAGSTPLKQPDASPPVAPAKPSPKASPKVPHRVKAGASTLGEAPAARQRRLSRSPRAGRAGSAARRRGGD